MTMILSEKTKQDVEYFRQRLTKKECLWYLKNYV